MAAGTTGAGALPGLGTRLGRALVASAWPSMPAGTSGLTGPRALRRAPQLEAPRGLRF